MNPSDQEFETQELRKARPLRAFLSSNCALRCAQIGTLALVTATSGCARWQTSETRRSWFGNPAIYREHAVGVDQLTAGLEKARAENKRVLLSLGANWCSDSQKMFHLLRTDRRIKRVLARDVVLVMVEVNDRDGPRRNALLLDHFPDALDRGIPALLILEADGRWLNTDSTERLDDSAHQNPAEVLACLQKWSGRSESGTQKLREKKPAS
jgi:hypothetical protein